MEAFSYLAVLVSIVLGLGITQILSGFAGWLVERKTVRLYPPSVIWAFSLLLVHIQTWWSMFGMRRWEEWNFLQFSVVLAQPILLYLLSTLVLPTAAAGERDLKTNYKENRVWFFGLFLMLIIVSITKDLVRRGSLPETGNLGFHIVLFIIGALAIGTRKDVCNVIIAVTALLMFIVYIGLLFADLT